MAQQLIPQDFEGFFGADRPTFAGLPEWYELGGHCSNCEREGWVDRAELKRRFGGDRYIHHLRPALRCLKCGNKGSNTWIIGKKPR